VGLASCGSSSPPARACTPGQSTACGCTNGAIGAQVCRVDGSGLAPCVCGSGGAGSGGSNGAGTGGGGASGAGSGGATGTGGAVPSGGSGGDRSGGTTGTGGVATGGRGTGGSGGTIGAGGGGGSGGNVGSGGSGGGSGSVGSGGAGSGGRATGGAGTGGVGTGGAGTGGAAVGAPCVPSTMFDDMEDGDGLICANAGRTGAWTMFLGENGQVDPPAGAITASAPIPGGRGASTRAMHFSGIGFTAPSYATIGGSLGAAYDLTPFTALRFWARSGSGPLAVRVDIPSLATEGIPEGGTCVPTTLLCYDYHGANVQVTASWEQYYVTFSQLTQLGWGRPAALDLAHSMWIQFHYSPVIGNLTNPGSFDLWIDDIEFVP
jgi:hypothetical protein